jgi:hypothetical protein
MKLHKNHAAEERIRTKKLFHKNSRKLDRKVMDWKWFSRDLPKILSFTRSWTPSVRPSVRPSLQPFFRPHSGGTERPATVLAMVCNRVVVTGDGFVTESSFPVTGLEQNRRFRWRFRDRIVVTGDGFLYSRSQEDPVAFPPRSVDRPGLGASNTSVETG